MEQTMYMHMKNNNDPMWKYQCKDNHNCEVAAACRNITNLLENTVYIH